MRGWLEEAPVRGTISMGGSARCFEAGNPFQLHVFGSVAPHMKSMAGSEGANSGVSDLFLEIYRAVSQIPEGRVATYGDVARAVGVPGAARAVGAAMARNADCKTVPCHRVVRAGGHAGEYAGGPAAKMRMLRVEGIEVSAAGRIADFDEIRWTRFAGRGARMRRKR